MRTKPVLAAVMVAALVSVATRAGAQCNASCQGDFNSDQQVTIDELVAAVHNALVGCGGAAEEGCIASGGTVSTGSCCSSAPDFPDTCQIGSCGCAPGLSRDLPICDCGEGRCFDHDQRACVAR